MQRVGVVARRSGVDGRSGWGRRVAHGLGWGFLLGALSTYGLAVLLERAWADCDVGINASANGFTLLVVMPQVWMLDTALFALVFALLWPGGRVRAGVATVAGLVAIVLVAWLVFARIGTPADYPNDFCPGNVPPWWPRWLPA